MLCREKQKLKGVMVWDRNQREMFDFLTSTNNQTMGIEGKTFKIDLCNGGCQMGNLIIKTPLGEVLADIGDYIVKYSESDFYPYKPHIFNRDFELVEE